jgi:chemotaxis-related protein WspB
MLFLNFHVGEERYAMEVNRVIEITPVARLRRLPLAEAYIAGIFNYRGTPVPVIDLRQLFEARACNRHMSTRIMVVRYSGHGGEPNTLGLIAERVTETVSLRPEDFCHAGVTIERAPFLLGIANDQRGLVQRIDCDRLLPDAVARQLFDQQPAPASQATL